MRIIIRTSIVPLSLCLVSLGLLVPAGAELVLLGTSIGVPSRGRVFDGDMARVDIEDVGVEGEVGEQVSNLIFVWVSACAI